MAVGSTQSGVSQAYFDQYVEAAVKLNPGMDQDQIKFALSHTIAREMREQGKVVDRTKLMADIGKTKGLQLAKAPSAVLHGNPPKVEKATVNTSAFVGHVGTLIAGAGIDEATVSIVPKPTDETPEKPNTVILEVQLLDGGMVHNVKAVRGEKRVDHNKWVEAMNPMTKNFPAGSFPKVNEHGISTVYVQVELPPPAEKPGA